MFRKNILPLLAPEGAHRGLLNQILYPLPCPVPALMLQNSRILKMGSVSLNRTKKFFDAFILRGTRKRDRWLPIAICFIQRQHLIDNIV